MPCATPPWTLPATSIGFMARSTRGERGARRVAALRARVLVRGEAERSRRHRGEGGWPARPYALGPGLRRCGSVGGGVRPALLGGRGPAGPFDVAGEAAAVE